MERVTWEQFQEWYDGLDFLEKMALRSVASAKLQLDAEERNDHDSGIGSSDVSCECMNLYRNWVWAEKPEFDVWLAQEQAEVKTELAYYA